MLRLLGRSGLVFLMAVVGAWSLGTTLAGPGPATAAEGQWAGAAVIGRVISPAIDPQVAMSPAGNAVAVWCQDEAAGDHVFANRYSPGGEWSGPTPIGPDSAGDAGHPEVATDPAGNAIAVWEQKSGTRYDVWANRYATESGWAGAAIIESGNAGDAVRPEVATDRAGNAIAVWEQSDGTRYNIWANRYVAGSGWVGAVMIESNDVGGAYSAQVAVDPNGNAVVAWEQYEGRRSDIWANRYVAASGWSRATLIERDNAGAAHSPEVAIDPAGNAVVVWDQSDGTRYNLWANRYVAGSGWSGAVLIESDNAGMASYPQVSMDSAGNATAVWRQSDGTRYNTCANRYTVGSGWGTATLIELNDSGDASSPQVAVDGSGNAMAVWQQSNATRNRYAQYQAPPEAPTIESVEPAQGNLGQSLQVLIRGHNLGGAAAVSFGPGVAVASYTANASQITAAITIAAGAGPGPRDVSVNTAGGTALKSEGFIVAGAALPPAISSISPAAGLRRQTLTLTITGTGFTGATTLSLGPGIAVSACSADNTTQIRATIAIGAEAQVGPRDVSVTAAGGVATGAGIFTVGTPPTLSTATSEITTSSCVVEVTGTVSSDTARPASVAYRIDEGDVWYPALLPASGSNVGNYTIEVFLPPGAHTLYIRAADSAGFTTPESAYAAVEITTGASESRLWLIAAIAVAVPVLVAVAGVVAWMFARRMRARAEHRDEPAPKTG